MRIEHPDEFKLGVRVIKRAWRNKDCTEGRRRDRMIIANGIEQWDEATAELLAECIPGERVYASSDRRNVDKAIRLFKERQLAADYQPTHDRYSFYHNCEWRWLSCLSAPQAAATMHFLFDCDDADDLAELVDIPAEHEVHRYATKSGTHVLTRPFNPNVLSPHGRALLHKDALLLVGYPDE